MSKKNNEMNPCAICYENITENNCVTTPCGHTFHFTCLTTNILKGTGDHSMNCPMCRELIVDKEFEDCQVEIVQDSDTDSIPSLEDADEPVGGYSTEEEEEAENNWQLEELYQEIINEQIYDKPMDQLINLIEYSFEKLGCRKELYKLQTVKSIVHKITVDVVKAFKSEKKRKAESVETRIEEHAAMSSTTRRTRTVRI